MHACIHTYIPTYILPTYLHTYTYIPDMPYKSLLPRSRHVLDPPSDLISLLCRRFPVCMNVCVRVCVCAYVYMRELDCAALSPI